MKDLTQDRIFKRKISGTSKLNFFATKKQLLFSNFKKAGESHD
jgi:hypothetical protein